MSDLDFSQTGMTANHSRPQPTLAQQSAPQFRRASPDGVPCREGFYWHPVIGEIPETMAGWDIHQAVLAHERRERERPEREAREAADREREARAAEEADLRRPPTLEERVAVLEAHVARLSAPTRLASRPKARPVRTTREGGDLPPAA
jgi:hypothetical protein